MLLSIVWIFVGGGLGSVARFLIAEWMLSIAGPDFPWGTLVANITGCFAIAFFAVLTGPDGRILAGPLARQFFMVGMCGGYTTFSSFSLQTLQLASSGEWQKASLNIAGSLVSCLIAVWAGTVLAGMINNAQGG